MADIIHKMDRQAPDVVLYHADCADGFGAAWAIWKRFPTAQFLAVKHGQAPPSGLERRHVVMVDFSYARPIIEQLAASTASLIILDHHVTAQASLGDLPFAFFDLQKSGAVLAWEWAHDEPVPWLLQYIQDKDLWMWSLPKSREINAALASYPFDFAVWDALEPSVLEIEGQAILRFEQSLIDDIVKEAVWISWEGERIPAVYSPILTSQIGERLCAGQPFAIIWHQQDGRRYISLRSQAGAADVSKIAMRYGGGGHQHAAGFSFSIADDSHGILDPTQGLVPSK